MEICDGWGVLEERLTGGDIFEALVVEIGAVLVVETGVEGYVVVTWEWFR